MFNLPWYAWFNVLALPCLWVYLMLACALLVASRDAGKEAASSGSTPTAPAYHLDDDDIDLDAVKGNDIYDEQRGKTIAALFSRDATLDDSLGNVMRLIGAEENVNTTGELLPLQLLQVLCMSSILVPPLVLGFQLIQ